MKTSRILIVTSEQASKDSIIRMLDKPPYVVSAVTDADSASLHVRSLGAPHLALVALTDRVDEGLAAARVLKKSADLPLIFIASVKDLESLGSHLRAYADDFVARPLHVEELEARMQLAMARVPERQYDRERLIELDELTIDFARSRLIVNGKSVRMSPTESELLHLLMRNAPHVVDCQTMLERVWSQDTVREDTLRVHIHRLRTKLETDAHHPRYIQTERGVGYRFAKRPGDMQAPAT